jgi:pimeloyl-ACP methyl ester carboxylesterase
MVQKRPELFSAYVGTGQVSSWAASVNYQFDFLKERARANGDATALASFEAIGRPDPTNVGQYFSFSRPLRATMGPADTRWNAEAAALAKVAGESEADIKAASDGANASASALIQTLVRLDLAKTAPRFAVPFYVIQGREDLNAPTGAAQTYFDSVMAPRKQFAVIDGAGHFALATHAEQFAELLKAFVK